MLDLRLSIRHQVVFSDCGSGNIPSLSIVSLDMIQPAMFMDYGVSNQWAGLFHTLLADTRRLCIRHPLSEAIDNSLRKNSKLVFRRDFSGVSEYVERDISDSDGTTPASPNSWDGQVFGPHCRGHLNAPALDLAC